MKGVYEVAGISKQAHWKHCANQARSSQDEAILLAEVARLRKLHPAMGGRKLYLLMAPGSMGRDRFLALLAMSGMLVTMRHNVARTTYSVKSSRFTNLLEGLSINGIDQVWVTDITYFFIGEDCFYVVMIMDLYSRRILGYSVEAHMRAESCMAALRMAFKLRGKRHYDQSLIHHSDRGAQYLSDQYTDALSLMGVRMSLCLTVYENSHMERLNGTIKNEYLTPYRPKDLPDLKRKLATAVRLYNEQRPHESLKMISPAAFEEHLARIPVDQRVPMSVYVDPETSKRNKLRNQVTLFKD